MITLENFSNTNRDKIIGNSLYRICQDKNNSQWYIHETYSDKNTWSGNNAFHDSSLEKVLNIFNSIKKEREVVGLIFK